MHPTPSLIRDVRALQAAKYGPEIVGKVLKKAGYFDDEIMEGLFEIYSHITKVVDALLAIYKPETVRALFSNPATAPIISREAKDLLGLWIAGYRGVEGLAIKLSQIPIDSESPMMRYDASRLARILMGQADFTGTQVVQGLKAAGFAIKDIGNTLSFRFFDHVDTVKLLKDFYSVEEIAEIFLKSRDNQFKPQYLRDEIKQYLINGGYTEDQAETGLRSVETKIKNKK